MRVQGNFSRSVFFVFPKLNLLKRSMSDLQGIESPEALMSIVVDAETPRNVPLSAKYKRSFGYPSMKDRVPIILSKIVDHLYRDKLSIIEDYGESSSEELKVCIGEISQLKNALQTGKALDYFLSLEPDTELWNKHIQRLKESGVKLNYYEADWLFAECYLYRKLREIFATKKYLANFDPFASSKENLLQDSIPAIVPLLTHLDSAGLLESSKQPPGEADLEKELTQLFKCAIWGNRLDLSLSGGTSSVCDDIFKVIDTWDHNIIVNHIDRAVSCLRNPAKSDKVVAFVTDNSGVEILCDLCLADLLVSRFGVSKVTFRVKRIPWYVSDVTSKDFAATLDTLSRHQDPIVRKFGDRWKNHVQSGLWEVTSDVYWSLGLSYSPMADEDPSLYSTLSSADLLIFKGDLNYRKLIQDTNWEPTTPFSEALGEFHPAPLLALRTNKCDCICGLKPGQAQELAQSDPNWMVSGDFAVAQFHSS